MTWRLVLLSRLVHYAFGTVHQPLVFCAPVLFELVRRQICVRREMKDTLSKLVLESICFQHTLHKKNVTSRRFVQHNRIPFGKLELVERSIGSLVLY